MDTVLRGTGLQHLAHTLEHSMVATVGSVALITTAFAAPALAAWGLLPPATAAVATKASPIGGAASDGLPPPRHRFSACDLLQLSVLGVFTLCGPASLVDTLYGLAALKVDVHVLMASPACPFFASPFEIP